jgi:magnesium chelatase subunit I
MGGSLKISESSSSAEVVAGLKKIQGLIEKTAVLGVRAKDAPGLAASAGEFILEGLYAHRRIGRSEERGFMVEERRQPGPVKGETRPPYKRQYN